MGKPTSLVSRGRVWYYRQRVPAELVKHIGKEAVGRSLKTGDYKEALRRHKQVQAEYDLLFELTRQQLCVHNSCGVLNPVSKQSADADDVATAYRLVSEYFLRYRETVQPETRIEVELNHGDPDLVEAELYTRVTELLDTENTQGSQSVFSVANKLSKDAGGELTDRPSFAEELRCQVRLALLELAEVDLSAFQGKAPSSGHLRFSSQPAPVITIGEAVALYRSQELDIKPGTPRTRKKREVTLDFVVRHFGLDTSIKAVTRADAVEFRNLIGKAPSNATKIFGNLPLRELAAKDKHPSYRVMAHNTQKTYLETAERFFDWAVEERMIELNPMRKLRSTAERTPAQEQRDAYTNDELNRIFAAPIYTGCVHDIRSFSRPGPNIIKRSRYWLPLIALFTGARPEEILQLTTNHVQVSDGGVHFFAITRDMKLKTDSAIREIPIHPTLEAIGFFDFVETKRAKGTELLFGDVPVGSDGTRSGIWSKRYSSFSRSIGVKSQRNCFYSFRHTFKNAVRRAAIPIEQANRLQGWSMNDESTGGRYGDGYEADQLAKWMAEISYPKVQLSHLIGSFSMCQPSDATGTS